MTCQGWLCSALQMPTLHVAPPPVNERPIVSTCRRPCVTVWATIVFLRCRRQWLTSQRTLVDTAPPCSCPCCPLLHTPQARERGWRVSSLQLGLLCADPPLPATADVPAAPGHGNTASVPDSAVPQPRGLQARSRRGPGPVPVISRWRISRCPSMKAMVAGGVTASASAGASFGVRHVPVDHLSPALATANAADPDLGLHSWIVQVLNSHVHDAGELESVAQETAEASTELASASVGMQPPAAVSSGTRVDGSGSLEVVADEDTAVDAERGTNTDEFDDACDEVFELPTALNMPHGDVGARRKHASTLGTRSHAHCTVPRPQPSGLWSRLRC